MTESHEPNATDQLYREIVENLAVGSAWVGREGELQSITGSFALLLGHRAAELTGARLNNFMPPDDAPRFARSLETAFAHPMVVQNIHCHLNAPDGTGRPCDLSLICPDAID